MKKFALLLLCVAALAAATDFPEEDDVLVLSTDNFDAALEAHDKILVEFYAPWCGHCKRLAPEYAKAAATLKEDGLALAKVDATANRELGDKFGVQGFPTLKWFVAGKPLDYSGGRTEAEIVNWVRKKSGPPAVDVASAADLEKFQGSADVTALGYFASAEDAEAKAFLTAAATFDDVPFAISYSADVAAAAGLEGAGVKLFKKGEDDLVFDGDATDSDAVLDWIKVNQLPLIMEFSQEIAGKAFGGPITTHLLLFLKKSDSEHEARLDVFRQVATAVKGKMLAIWVGDDNSRLFEYFAIDADALPSALVLTMKDDGMKKYRYDGDDFSAAGLTAFTDDFFAGNVAPHLKSEEVPEDNDGPVTVIVGKNFEDVVVNSDKDVLLEFYAPWCGHCKALAPKWEELGEKLADNDHIVIAKMDATANEVDHPGVNVRGFPTIKFFPAGDKQNPLEYSGDRTVDGFVEYLNKHASKPVEVSHDDEL